MGNLQRNRGRQGLRGVELRRVPGQLRGRRREGSRRWEPWTAAERFHLYGAKALLPEPFLAAALQPALQKTAETAEHDDEGPDQPEAGKTGQEGVGALRHHHGRGWAGSPRGQKSCFQSLLCELKSSRIRKRLTFSSDSTLNYKFLQKYSYLKTAVL